MVELDETMKKLLAEIIPQFEGLTKYTKERLVESNKPPIYLPATSCPTGLRACDPFSEECPSERFAMNPHVYTSDGKRCFSEAGVSDVRPESPEKFRVATVELTTKIAKLITSIKNNIGDVQCSDAGMTADVCGMKATCNWVKAAGGKAGHCETSTSS